MKRINMWSGPRNISTAMMYAFAQRKDTTVYDEPLYAHYLSKTPADAYHPMAEEILADMENNGDKVIQMMQGNHASPVAFFKQMTHHLVELDWSFMDDMVNVILTRDPREMLTSFIQQIENPTIKDVGYAAHIQVLEYLESKGQKVIVLDGKNVLLDPKGVLTKFCEQLGIPFDESMLSWKAGARAEDGIWAPHWYANVHRSTGFAPYKAKDIEFPERLEALYVECMPYYERLSALAIR